MHTVAELQQIVKEFLNSQKFEGNPSLLYEPIQYTLSQNGKQLRPVLTLLGCELFGGKIEKALYPAIGLEIFHNFTLLHDDIMDKAPLRRGKETVYKKWNTNIAILSGDTMFALAYDYMIKTDNSIVSDILHVLNKTVIEVCEGQQFDMNFETQENVSIPDYINMIRLKTAVLLGACLKIGAIIANAPKKEAEHLYNFGINIGIAFQLMDDLLDVFADNEKFGKVIGGDIVTNKKTYLYLKAYEIADENETKLLNRYFGLPDFKNEEKISGVKKLYSKLKIQENTNKEIENYYNKALIEFEKVKVDKSFKKNLLEFSDALMNRKV